MTSIKHKNSTVAGNAPSAGDLEVAELAVNLADKKLYCKDNNNQIFEIGPNATGAPDLGDGGGATLDARYVQTKPAGDATQDVSGSLTVGGGDITLDKSGSAEFAGDGQFKCGGTDPLEHQLSSCSMTAKSRSGDQQDVAKLLI